MPNGECPPDLFLELDRLADSHGQGDLRATTRQAFQLHGVVKKDVRAAAAPRLGRRCRRCLARG